MKKNFEIKITGKSKGEWIFYKGFHETVDYLSNHKKILRFNPFCRNVEQLGEGDVYKWHFRVTDPQNNPFDIFFFIEESQELMVSLPEAYEDMEPDDIPEEIIHDSTVGRRIIWKHHPTAKKIDDPSRYVFEGKVFAEMHVEPYRKTQTRVHFDLKVNVWFTLYPAFRIIPEKVLRKMTNAGMSFIMQTSTDKMFRSISRDFARIQAV